MHTFFPSTLSNGTLVASFDDMHDVKIVFYGLLHNIVYVSVVKDVCLLLFYACSCLSLTDSCRSDKKIPEETCKKQIAER